MSANHRYDTEALRKRNAAILELWDRFEHLPRGGPRGGNKRRHEGSANWIAEQLNTTRSVVLQQVYKRRQRASNDNAAPIEQQKREPWRPRTDY